MSDKGESFTEVPESRIVVKRRTRLSLVWVIPIVAAVAGAWITATRILSKGPEITIVFQSADGLEAHKTKVNYNGLDIGVLKTIRLSDDRKSMIATAQMSPNAKDLLGKDAKFWVVRPRISGMNVSGLSTLISGSYIGMQLGQSQEKGFSFIALETPPLTGDVPGRLFALKTSALGSLDFGTPVFFRQLQVGQVVSYELDKGGEFLNVKVFVQEPYDKYVSPDTRFWQVSGIDVSLSANGINIKTESLMSILAGGVAFETPASDLILPPAEAGTTFNLFVDRTEAFKPPVRDPHSYLLAFKQSVRGLTLGSPVQFYGITIGEVTKIRPQLDVNTMECFVEVGICVDPERYGVKFMDVSVGIDSVVDHRKMIDTLISRGVRAQLSSGNLLTGSLLVSLCFVPDAPAVQLDWSQDPLHLPTMPGKLDSIEDSISGLINNINQAVAGARGTLSNADKLIDSANQLVEPNSVMNSELNSMLRQGSGAARSLRVLADYLERHPEALIHGKTGEGK
jgi:paraquat-inducible protein B